VSNYGVVKIARSSFEVVALSLALFSLGGSDPTGSFHLATLSVGSPWAIEGPIMDMVAISHDVEGALSSGGM
jgi:hypothetical protein